MGKKTRTSDARLKDKMVTSINKDIIYRDASQIYFLNELTCNYIKAFW